MRPVLVEAAPDVWVDPENIAAVSASINPPGFVRVQMKRGGELMIRGPVAAVMDRLWGYTVAPEGS